VVRFHLAGEDLTAAIDRLAPRTLVVRTGGVARGRWVALGTGEIDHQRVLGRLAEAGYVGFVIVEMQIAARAEVEGLMVRARELLEPLTREPAVQPLITPRTPTDGTSLPPAR